ncbi:uncharacterized protein LOC111912704 [Lactuca sativa]|uniref:uncharacterized protein LOC111912704 n=1 Tax=Lactuca sativa TaxID=4236 RepID=UPI000CD9CF92|nr:uncharacterized protein LOC111912704 [Lactuca sativa]
MMRHGIGRELIEQKVTFMNRLRSKWKAVVSIVKAHEQFNNYTLARLVGILKAQESEVIKEAKVVFGMGSFALVAKGKTVADDVSDLDHFEYELSNEDFALMGSYNSKKVKEENKSGSHKEEEKKEKKVVDDSGYDCNYFHGKNHLAKECMLRRKNEKNEGEDEEAYHMQKLEEIKKKKSSDNYMPAFVVQENLAQGEFGGVEVWSTDSEDEEVRKPTHGRVFVAKEHNSQCSRRWLMVTEGGSQMKENASGSGRSEDSCFAARPVPEQINECEHLINKEDEIDADCYNCECIVSSEETSDAYKVGLERIENYIKSKDHKNTLKQLLDENDKKQIKSDTDSDMSDISVEDEVDCSEFVKIESHPAKALISEIFVKFARVVQNKPEILKVKATVFPKVQTRPNQVFKVNGVTKNQTIELKTIVEEDNKDGCDEFFWSAPIDNADETVIRDEQFDTKWYIDSGCSRHMTGRKEELREFRALKDGGNVKYGNNYFGRIKGYDMITNGKFSIRKVAYVEGLQHNLISVSRLGVRIGLKVSFNDEGSEIIEKKSKTASFTLKLQRHQQACLGDHVRGLPLLKFDKDHLCAACEMRKQSRKSHPFIVNTKVIEPLELLHIDLCRPSSIESVGGSKYILVIVDDFLCFTWVFFLRQKSEETPKLKDFIKEIKLQLRKLVRNVRSDNELEFKNQAFEEFLAEKGVTHNFYAPYTPQ